MRKNAYQLAGGCARSTTNRSSRASSHNWALIRHARGAIGADEVLVEAIELALELGDHSGLLEALENAAVPLSERKQADAAQVPHPIFRQDVP